MNSDLLLEEVGLMVTASHNPVEVHFMNTRNSVNGYILIAGHVLGQWSEVG